MTDFNNNMDDLNNTENEIQKVDEHIYYGNDSIVFKKSVEDAFHTLDSMDIHLKEYRKTLYEVCKNFGIKPHELITYIQYKDKKEK